MISSSPASMRRAVVLPQPDGPDQDQELAVRTWMFRSLTAVTFAVLLVHVVEGDSRHRSRSSLHGMPEGQLGPSLSGTAS